MISFLATPLLQFWDIMTVQQALLCSYLLSTVFTAPLWFLAGKQDYKRHEIDDLVCKGILLLTTINSLLFVGVGSFVATAILAYLTLRDREVALVGQADFMMIAHWISASYVFDTGSGVMMVYSTSFLAAIAIYVVVYRDENGKRWHRGKMVPIIPPYTAVVLLAVIYKYPLGLYMYSIGW